MEQLNAKYNKLQDVLADARIENDVKLPMITVVGSESAGKSSVIEAIVGRDFLPRGPGVVTRRPLILHLIQIPHTADDCESGDSKTAKSKGGNQHQDYATFDHRKDERGCPIIFTDFRRVRAEIIDDTNRVIKNDKDIIDKPIILNIHSTRYSNLTLVDLPGITKNPLEGQQSDIEKCVTDIIRPHIENENSMILAITPANHELVNSVGINLALEVNPGGSRTLCVLTKVDLMEDGSRNKEVLLTGNVGIANAENLLGIIGVVNRSKEETDQNKTIAEALRSEKKFFETNYSVIGSRNGTPFLVKTLCDFLDTKFRSCMPKLQKHVNDRFADYEKFGEPYADPGDALLQEIKKFQAKYTESLGLSQNDIMVAQMSGTGERHSLPNKISIGTRINQVLNNDFKKKMNDLDPLKGLTDVNILTVLNNHRPLNPSVVISDGAFERLIRNQIQQFRDPILACVEDVRDLMQEALSDIRIGQKIQYDVFYKMAEDIVVSMLDERRQPTLDSVEMLLKAQNAHIDVIHVNFKGNQMTIGTKPVAPGKPATPDPTMQLEGIDLFYNMSENLSALEQLTMHPSGGQNPSPQTSARGTTDKSENNCGLMKMLITSYFNIDRACLLNLVPKLIVHQLVKDVEFRLHDKLVKELFRSREYNIKDLLQESRLVAEERKECQKKIKALRTAKEVIAEINQITGGGTDGERSLSPGTSG